MRRNQNRIVGKPFVQTLKVKIGSPQTYLKECDLPILHGVRIRSYEWFLKSNTMVLLKAKFEMTYTFISPT